MNSHTNSSTIGTVGRTTLGLAALVVGFSLSMSAQPANAQAARAVTFRNLTGQDVDDLHVETKQHVTINSKSPFTGDRPKGTNNHHYWGETIPRQVPPADPSTAVIDMSTTSSKITITKWWWTLGGTNEKNGVRVGTVNGDTGANVLSADGGPAAGDGLIIVSIDGVENIYQTMPGMLPEQTAETFNMFLEMFVDPDTGFDLIHNVWISPNEVLAAGNIMGDPGAVLRLQILVPDSFQNLQLTPQQSSLFALDTTGACPGATSLTTSQGTPFGNVAFVYGFSEGSTPVPPCPGLSIDISRPIVAGIVTADAAGQAVLTGNVPASGCGVVVVQAVDLASCEASDLNYL